LAHTHKVLFLNKETLRVDGVEHVTSPQVISTTEIEFENGGFAHIMKPFMVVESSFDEEKEVITQEVYSEYVRSITMAYLEKKYKEAQVSLMSNSEDYEEYLIKESELKKKFFEYKKQVMLSENSLDLKIVF